MTGPLATAARQIAPMQTIATAAEMTAFVDKAHANGKTVAFVPTMGALHAGHLSLVHLARSLADIVVVSIFVNPLQFGANEDFDRYPRTLDADAAKLAEARVNVLFAPTATEVYPPDSQPRQLKAGVVGAPFDGAIRPGHFDGMLTVVNRLFDIVTPDVAIFGAKDAQQVFLVKQMAAKLHPRLKIVEAPTVREFDGLAMSSRNRYLNPNERALAAQISRALTRCQEVADARGTAAQAAKQAAAVIAEKPAIRLEYLALIDPNTFKEVPATFKGQCLAIIAARIGETRLIDNLRIAF